MFKIDLLAALHECRTQGPRALRAWAHECQWSLSVR